MTDTEGIKESAGIFEEDELSRQISETWFGGTVNTTRELGGTAICEDVCS